MRRADERRSASVMISSSIRWSLAGNDVDWMTYASEPRTFSRISTKISLSANRRTLALVSGMSRPWAMACARAGLELPAISLIEPFLADIEASPRALLDTTFSISDTCKPAGFDGRGDIRQVARLATHGGGFPCQKCPRYGTLRGCVNGWYSPARPCRTHPRRVRPAPRSRPRSHAGRAPEPKAACR